MYVVHTSYSNSGKMVEYSRFRQQIFIYASNEKLFPNNKRHTHSIYIIHTLYLFRIRLFINCIKVTKSSIYLLANLHVKIYVKKFHSQHMVFFCVFQFYPQNR